LYYPVPGLVGESGEVVEKINGEVDREEVAKEIGDVLWYVSNVCSEISLDMSELFGIFVIEQEILNYKYTELSARLFHSVAMIAETTKKIMRDSGGEIEYPKQVVLQVHLCYIAMIMKRYAEYRNYALITVAELNIEKLFSRKERGVLKGSGDNR